MKLPPGHVAGMGVQKATAFGGFGQKMLEKMGWNRGQGLGKQKHGMREAIEVKKKEDNLGVGANTTGWKWDWKYWEDAYNSGLQNISKSDQERKRRKLPSISSSDNSSDSSASDSVSDSDSSESDDEHNTRIAEACGVVFNRDGTAASASAAELKLAEELSKDSRGPAGRFGGRAGKMARIRQQEEEQAAAMRTRLGIPQSASTGNLGNSSASEDTSAGKSSSKKRKQLSASAAAGSTSDAGQAAAAAAVEQRQRKKSRRDRKDAGGTILQQQQASEQEAAAAAAAAADDARKAPLVVVVDIKGAGPNVEAFKAFKQTPATGWWGAKMFASAGLLESIDDEHKQRQRTTFDEDMQTRVYMAAHNTQRQGRKGLGKSTTLNIAGGNWQGKKVAFDQEAVAGADSAVPEHTGNDQQQEQQADPSSSPSSTIAMSTKATSQKTGTRNPKKQKNSDKPGKVKWAKLAVTQLQEVPGGVLKWSKLWKQLKQAAQTQQVEVAGSCKERAWRKLQKCNQLQVTGELVSLAA